MRDRAAWKHFGMNSILERLSVIEKVGYTSVICPPI